MSRRARRLRFTREGKYFVAITLGIGFAAINTANNLLFLILGLMLSMIVGSGVLSELNLRRLIVSRRRPERVFANRPFLLGLNLRNEKKRVASFSVEVEDVLNGRPLAKKCYFLKVQPDGTQLASYRHQFARRGQFCLEAVRLRTRYPFALFEKSRTVRLETSILVYPEIHAVRASGGRLAGLGDEQRGKPGRRGEYHALRDFREGDDPHDIFWRKSATVGRLLVREHEEPVWQRAFIFLDNRRVDQADERQRKEEDAVSRAASLAAQLIKLGRRVALATHDLRIPPGSGPAQLDKILRALALVEFLPGMPAGTRPKGVPADHIYVGLASLDGKPDAERHLRLAV